MIKKRASELIVMIPGLLIILNSCFFSDIASCGSLDCTRDTKKDHQIMLLTFLSQDSYNCSKIPENTASFMNEESLYEESSFPGRISQDQWNEAAVRRILMAFQFGGPATETKILEWASMKPESAIIQMLHLDGGAPEITVSYPASDSGPLRNDLLTMSCASDYLISDYSYLPESEKRYYKLRSYNGPERIWYEMTMARGSNPFRQLTGLFMTNYHLSVNQNIVPGHIIGYYYDSILDDLAKGLPYQQVLANAALSAAIAIQYNHRENQFRDGRFYGNEDFARELHQLFFGILGTGLNSGDVNQTDNTEFKNHETITIPNTAKALTDMPVLEDETGEYTWTVDFGTDFHYNGELEILGYQISGSNAPERIRAVAEKAISHSESLANLPLIIVRGLADDNLTDTGDPDVSAKIDVIRNIWAAMPDKNYLIFIRRYALSTAFHNVSRIKYRTSADRHMTAVNLLIENGSEVRNGFFRPVNQIRSEGMEIFRPSHDVFGNQTGTEASDTPDIFLNQYNMSIAQYYTYGSGVRYSGNSVTWEKNFADMLFPGETQAMTVKDTAERLWRRFTGDNEMKYLSDLERAHLYAILVSGTDLPYYLAKEKNDAAINSKVYTVTEIKSDPELNRILFIDAPQQRVNFKNPDPEIRRDAVNRTAMAASFIISLPYFYVNEGL